MRKLGAILLTVVLAVALAIPMAMPVVSAADVTDSYYSDGVTTEAAGYTIINPMDAITPDPVDPSYYEGSWSTAIDLSSPVGGWYPENSGPSLNSYWVSNNDGLYGEGTQGNKEDDQWRLFRQEIIVPPSAVNIEGRVWMAADNDVIAYFNDKDTEIWEMGDVYGPAPGDPQPPYYDVWNGPYTFTPEAGINYLYFVVRNWGHTTSYVGNPTGLLYRVEVDYDLATLDDLTPNDVYNPVGIQHCVTATVDPADAGAIVSFMVTGANPTTPPDYTDTTDESGEAHFCYTGNSAGMDIIRAYFDEDFDGEWDDPEEPSITVTKYWLEPFVTGGGNIKFATVKPNGKTIEEVIWTFGGNVGLLGNGSTSIVGQFQIVDHTGKEAWHCHNDFSSLVFSGSPIDGPPGPDAQWSVATFTGNFTSNRGGSATLTVVITDVFEPGKDYDTIEVTGGPTFSGVPISGGNFQIHDEDD